MDTRSEYTGSDRFLIGFIAGGVIGTVLAMVCAPRVADLRRRVSASTADLGDNHADHRDLSARVTGAVDVAATGQSVRDNVADTSWMVRHVEQFAVAAKSVPIGRRSS